MAKIVIKDLEVNRELDRKALTSVTGGSGGPYFSPSTGGANTAQAAMAYLGNYPYPGLVFNPVAMFGPKFPYF